MYKVRSLFCVDCLKEFGTDASYCAQDKCSPCYQKSYNKKKIGRPKSKETKCINCELEFGTLDERNKPVRKGSKKMCKRCYTKQNKPTKICKECGNEMLNLSVLSLCGVCKLKRPVKRTRKSAEIPRIEYENFELIRRLLVRYKLGMNNQIDDFRVVDVYLDIKEAPAFLDTLSERSQIVEMLKTLKETFDYNLKLDKEEAIKKPQERKNKAYQKNWYKTSNKSYKNKHKVK